jgi:hypothetical protein
MARVTWGDAGQRFYEAGADRGVLYVGDDAGVPWNGLTSVRENPSGGEPQPFYIDGFKYINLASAEEFEASIDAFSSPAAFGVCDGTMLIANGLSITQQHRQEFNLCYRTMLGNDVAGLDYGYKLHLVYKALAKPASRANRSLNDSPEPNTLSWDITTAPPRITGYRPTAHMVVNSRTTPTELLAELEDMLYGTEFTDPYMPEQAALITMFDV